MDLRTSYLLEAKRTALSSYTFQLIKPFLVRDVLMSLTFPTHSLISSFVVVVIFFLRPGFPNGWTSGVIIMNHTDSPMYFNNQSFSSLFIYF